MSEGYEPIPNKSPVLYNAAQTGITGVTACKCGHIVQLFIDRTISASAGGWVNIGTLPEALIPCGASSFALYDNSASSSAANGVVDLRILSNGNILIYAFSDKLSFAALGTVTYISNHG